MIYEVEGLNGRIMVEYYESGELHSCDAPKPEPVMLEEEASRALALDVRLAFCVAQEADAKELWEAAVRAQVGAENRPIIYERDSSDTSLANDEYQRRFRERLAAENAVNDLRLAVRARAQRDEQPPAPVVVAPQSREALLADMRARLLGKRARRKA